MMFSNIHSSDGSLMISNMSSSMPYVTANLNDVRAVDGDVRFNNNQVEVYSCGAWLVVASPSVDIQLMPDDRAALTWAKNKMSEEEKEKEKELIAKYPALKSAKEKFETIKALVNNEN